MARALLVNVGFGDGERVLLMKYSGLLRVFTPSLALLKDVSPPFFLCLLQCNRPASVCSLAYQVPSCIKNFALAVPFVDLSFLQIFLRCLPLILQFSPKLLLPLSDRLFPTNPSLCISISPFFWQPLSLLEIILSTCLFVSLARI